jgi:dTDP-4-amino-4,6-dideoxygalactose transaminase
MDEIQAVVLRVKLKRLDVDNQHRREIANQYIENLKNPLIEIPSIENCSSNRSHVWHIFLIRCKKRKELMEYLLANDIQTLIHYPIPPHKQLAYKQLNSLNLPVTEKIHDEVLSLPISPVMEISQVNKIIELINHF